MTAFQVTGKTVTFTGAGSAPTAVQCVSHDNTRSTQVMMTNVGSVPVFVGWGSSAAEAAANAVVPTATSQLVYPLLNGTQVVMTVPSGQYFTGITSSSTAIVYVTPGYGE